MSSLQQPTPPAIPPPCGSECQKQRKLAALKAALDAKTLTRDADPQGYQTARIAYYREKDGEAWLETEKERIRKEEIEPVLRNYKLRYDNLKSDTKNSGVFVNLMNLLKSSQTTSDEELRFLNKKAGADGDKASAINRMNELNEPSPQPSKSYIPIIVYIALGIMGLLVVGKIYKRFFSTPTLMTAGKRVLNKLIR